MGKIKNWMIDMERHVVESLDEDSDRTLSEVIENVHFRMGRHYSAGPPMDISYITKIYNEYHAYEYAADRHYSDIIN
jgi:hypothetical protein